MIRRPYPSEWRMAIVILALAASTPTGAQRTDEQYVEWRAYAATNASSQYAPLDQINRDTVKRLQIAWRQSNMPAEVRRGRASVPLHINYQVTPIMTGGMLYTSAGDGSVLALDPTSGDVVWTYVPPDLRGTEATTSPARELVVAGRNVNRGVAYWSDETQSRIITVVARTLTALDAKTGQPCADFGVAGRVDLTKGYRRPAASYVWRSMPTIVKDVIVVGGFASGPDGRPIPGDIRGFDVRTGRQLWTFHVIPEPGEFGYETWLKDSASYSGNAGSWGIMSADDELGYVYIPMETPASLGADFWGGKRPGNGLFAESLLCLDARTGKRVWHFQVVHHGLWDWDLNAPPNLVDITVDGRQIQAVAQVSKQAFVYIFDRVTGEPVWPIIERPVPKGDTPGEWYSPTQPIPTKPPAYDQQGITIDDLIDFTPELRQEAIEILSQYRYGSMFTPPSIAGGPDGKKGTAQMPGSAGGTTLFGAGADPETGILYVPSVHGPFIAELIRPDASPDGPADQARIEWTTRFFRSEDYSNVGPFLYGPQGLPIFKPPYGRLVAIDLNKGEILWTVANGNGPRDHPAIKHLNLPPLGQGGRAGPLVTKTMVFLGEGGNSGIPALPPGGGGKMFRAYDKATGEVLWEMELPGGTTGAPMTYMVNGKQYIVVAVGWEKTPGELVALALPS